MMKNLSILIALLCASTAVSAECQWLGTAPICGYGATSRCPSGAEPFCYGDSKFGSADRCGDAIASEFGNGCVYGKKICCD